MKVIKISKYDLIIYSCLLGALICLGIGTKEYFDSLNEESTMKKELSSLIKEVRGKSGDEEQVYVEEVEPVSLQEFDKSLVVLNYFNEILDRIVEDDVVSYEMIRSWGEFEVLDIRYVREVASKYYEYEVDLKINNKDAKLPKMINEKLSNDEYNVITMNIYILEDGESNSYNVRKLEI